VNTKELVVKVNVYGKVELKDLEIGIYKVVVLQGEKPEANRRARH